MVGGGGVTGGSVTGGWVGGGMVGLLRKTYKCYLMHLLMIFKKLTALHKVGMDYCTVDMACSGKEN